MPGSMVTGEDIISGKPAPDCYLLGAQRLGFPVQDCVVFEDAPVGIRSAEAAGAGLVVVGSAHRHRASQALLSIDDYHEIVFHMDDDVVVLARR